LLLSAVLRPWAAAPLLLGARRPSLSIDLLLSSKPAERRCCVRMMDRLTDGQMDGRTDGHPTVS